jgi:hypothetical protein
MAANPTPAPHFDNEVTVTWDNQNHLITQPNIPLKVNQFVKYTNATGESRAVLTLTFDNDSPFATERVRVVVKQDEVTQLVKPGRFFCGCTLVFPGGEQKGWDITQGPGSPNGGIHDVHPLP